MPLSTTAVEYIRWFADLGLDDIPLVGGKNASQGHAALLDTCKRCLASLFTDRAISYRADQGFDHSAIVAHLFDERNPAVTTMIANVIQAAKATGRKIGICGQAPSDYPAFAQFLVEQGIDSISLHPDAVLQTLVAIAAIAQRSNSV
jgi:phosphoenolpyruvate synthase/pyruvate phosphate dikinase